MSLYCYHEIGGHFDYFNNACYSSIGTTQEQCDQWAEMSCASFHMAAPKQGDLLQCYLSYQKEFDPCEDPANYCYQEIGGVYDKGQKKCSSPNVPNYATQDKCDQWAKESCAISHKAESVPGNPL